MHRYTDAPMPRLPVLKGHQKMRKLLIACVAYLLLSVLGGIVLAEGSLRLHHRPLSHQQEAEALVRQEFHAKLQEVSITAADGVVLKGWYVHPQQANGYTVLLAMALPIIGKA